MPIVKAKSLKESYRHRAKSGNINELNGRGSSAYLTKFVAKNIVDQLPVKNGDYIVDIGCGDCSFFNELIQTGENFANCSLIGILPNIEELNVVQGHIGKASSIQLHLANITNLKLPFECADIVVMNSVLHGATQNIEQVKQVIENIWSIIKKNGLFYLGELPYVDEFQDRDYSPDSIFGWLLWTLRRKGIRTFFTSMAKVIKCKVTSEPFIIEPKTRFYIRPKDLILFMETLGFVVVSYRPHDQIDIHGHVSKSPTRYNYVFKKV